MNFERLIQIYERALVRLLKQGGPLINERAIEALISSREFNRGAEQIAARMARNILVSNAKSWREAAARGSNARKLSQLLARQLRGTRVEQMAQQIVRNNAESIRTLPLNISRRVTEYVAHAQMQGLRDREIAANLKARLPHMAESSIRLIARTEVGKAETALTEARSRDIGIEWFQWETSEDQRVRQSHRNMDKVLVSWNDLPSPELLVGEKNAGHYAPGGIYNCRCLALPVAAIEEISWPARVYNHGSITRMSWRDFEKKFWMAPERIAA